MIGLQGKKIPAENLPASNLVFLIDVSGSMQGADKVAIGKSFYENAGGSVARTG